MQVAVITADFVFVFISCQEVIGEGELDSVTSVLQRPGQNRSQGSRIHWLGECGPQTSGDGWRGEGKATAAQTVGHFLQRPLALFAHRRLRFAKNAGDVPQAAAFVITHQDYPLIILRERLQGGIQVGQGLF